MIFSIWYQKLNDQAITSSNLTIPIYLIKIKHNIVWVYISFKIKEFLFEGLYEF